MIIKLLTILFALFLIAIIITANQGFSPETYNLIESIPGNDHTGHFILMGILAFLITLSFPNKTIKLGPFNLNLALLIVTAIITAEEFSQIFIKTRGFDLQDLACDYLGILTFGLIALRLKKSKPTDPSTNSKDQP
ncbi:MAG: hypothetical protein GY869_25960 [Planctomycetes bacterium]|nr:hypothetical protein [Planctomycetota bacterium]